LGLPGPSFGSKSYRARVLDPLSSPRQARGWRSEVWQVWPGEDVHRRGLLHDLLRATTFETISNKVKQSNAKRCKQRKADSHPVSALHLHLHLSLHLLTLTFTLTLTLTITHLHLHLHLLTLTR